MSVLAPSHASSEGPLAKPFAEVTPEALEIAAKRLSEWRLVEYWRDAVAEWAPGNSHGVAPLEWNTGRLVPGYDALRQEAAKVVCDLLPVIIGKALDRIEGRAREAVTRATQARPEGTGDQ